MVLKDAYHTPTVKVRNSVKNEGIIAYWMRRIFSVEKHKICKLKGHIL